MSSQRHGEPRKALSVDRSVDRDRDRDHRDRDRDRDRDREGTKNSKQLNRSPSPKKKERSKVTHRSRAASADADHSSSRKPRSPKPPPGAPVSNPRQPAPPSVSGLVISMSASEPGNSLYILFNFLDQSPQATSSGQGGGNDGYWTVVQAMQQHDQFLEGMLLKNVDERSSFPYLHYVVFNTSREGGFQKDESWSKTVDDGYGPGQTKNQSAYEEMYTFIAPSLPFLPKRSNNPNVAYIVSAFKTLGGLDALDQTWSIWSGADFIAANAPPALKLQRLTLHKRTDLRGTFTYVLICELSEGLADVMRTREFIEKIKCRECGFTSLFAVDHFF